MTLHSKYPWLDDWPTREALPAISLPETAGFSWPSVSIVTPSFNQADYLESCILSVIRQDYPHLEYLIQDGGSTDGSLGIIKRYGGQIASWDSSPDSGQSEAVNRGWARATGKYVWYLNSDDMLTPRSLFKSVQFLERNPAADMVYGDLIIIDDKGKAVEYFSYEPFNFTKMLLEGLDLPQAGALIRREVVSEIGPLDAELHYVMDLEFWHRVALSGKKIEYIHEPLALFRVYDTSKTQSGSSRAVEERHLVAQRLISHPSCPTEVRVRKRKYLSTVYFACARTWIKSQQFGKALGTLMRGTFVYPGFLLDVKLYYSIFISLLGMIVGQSRWLQLRTKIRAWRRSRT